MDNIRLHDTLQPLVQTFVEICEQKNLSFYRLNDKISVVMQFENCDCYGDPIYDSKYVIYWGEHFIVDIETLYNKINIWFHNMNYEEDIEQILKDTISLLRERH